MATDAQRPVLNILLVEDHPVVAQVTVQLLRRLGHAPAHAETVAAAAAALRQNRYDVLLCDFSLPDGNAFDLVRQFNGDLPPAILLSAYEADAMPETDDDGHFALTLEKPVDPARLDEVLRRVVN